VSAAPVGCLDEREAFEAWIRTLEGHPFAGQFANLMWAAWQARSASRQEGWQPIETAPKDGTYILVSNPTAGGSWVAQFQQFAASGFRFDEPWHSVMLNHWHLPDRHGGTPTHWTPLPTPPRSES